MSAGSQEPSYPLRPNFNVFAAHRLQQWVSARWFHARASKLRAPRGALIVIRNIAGLQRDATDFRMPAGKKIFAAFRRARPLSPRRCGARR
jgi:hypothetical protein